jgi:hypothetical protein
MVVGSVRVPNQPFDPGWVAKSCQTHRGMKSNARGLFVRRERLGEKFSGSRVAGPGQRDDVMVKLFTL